MKLINSLKHFFLLTYLLFVAILLHAQWNTDTLNGGNKFINRLTNFNWQITIPDLIGGNLVVFEKSGFDSLLNPTSNRSICLQRIDSSGRLKLGSADSGKVLVSHGDNVFFDAVPDGEGGIYIAYSTTDLEATSGIVKEILYVQRFDATGFPYWGTTRVKVASIAANIGYLEARITELESHEVAIAWTAYNSPTITTDLWAQKINPYGLTYWGDSGVRISRVLKAEVSKFSVLPDNSGGILVTFNDMRYSPPDPITGRPYRDLFFQHIQQNGLPTLAVGGVPVFTEIYSKLLPARFPNQQTSLSDGSGGQYLLFRRSLCPNEDSVDLCLQRINSAGQSLFPGFGVPLIREGTGNKLGANLCLTKAENNSVICYLQVAAASANFRTAPKQLRAFKVNAVGQSLWGGTNGILIDTSWSNYNTYGKRAFDATGDTSGNQMVVYMRYRHDTANQVAIQRLNIYGQKEFPAKGKTIYTSRASSVDVNLNSDGYFLVNWSDARNYPNNLFIWDTKIDLFSKRIDLTGQVSGERRIIYSQTSGNWNNPATWQGGVVPTLDDEVVVRHQVTVTASTGCYSLRVETATGRILILAGMNLQVVH